ncbi:MAG TPA: ankyrin repeat domain-containing protein [Gemmatimonadales bacterium]|nr:ankyrin repeat domain-containing protein [Gemmatimonadales bacterium]
MAAGTELFDAIRAGDVTRVRGLLAADPGLVNRRNERGHSPVLIAQYHHKGDVVTVLLEAGPELDLFDACAVGRAERVAELLDRDPSQVNAYSGDGFYPLGLAAFFGRPATVRLLLTRGADVAQVARNPMQVQALHSAAAGKNFETVRLLVEAGAPVNAKQHKGWAPLHEAVLSRDVEMTRYLLAHGADPKQQNDEGKSAIGLAAEAGEAAILKLLKGQG